LRFKLQILFACFFIFFLFEGLSLLFEDGITGQTKRDGGVGCVCHRLLPDPTVSVVFQGPDSVAVGQTAVFKLVLSHGPAQTGGCDIASFHGIIDTSYLDFHTLQRDTVRNELTHRFPKYFIADSVYWTFKYTAPSSPQYDTLYACGNSTNADFQDDTDDHWNFANNFPIRVYNPIGIKPISQEVPGDFQLYQNYPNPFNPSTNIRFDIPSGMNSAVNLDVYDILGNRVAELINETVMKAGRYQVGWNAQKQSSGIYLIRLRTGNYSVTRKMILMK
jgi:hypothetical protein